VLPRLHIPYAHRLVARTRGEQAAVGRKVERVDLLLMPLEDVTDSPFRNVPDLTEGMER